jgi:DNA anti-recombination protein RmuC
VGRVISTAIQLIDGFTKPSKEVINNMRKMGNEAVKAGKQIQNAGKSISNVGSTLTKSVTVPILAIGTAAVKTSTDFEAQMSRVQAISGASGKDLKNLTKQAIDLGASSVYSAKQAAEGMEND